jgi:hypothetical protein
LHALTQGRFWEELLVVIPLSLLGIWWPWWFDWKDADDLLRPVPWFTFGMATLMTILAKRFFMESKDDEYLKVNKFILLIVSFYASILFGLSMLNHLGNQSNLNYFFDVSNTSIAICLTAFAWFLNFVSSNDFDEIDMFSSLGGKK